MQRRVESPTQELGPELMNEGRRSWRRIRAHEVGSRALEWARSPEWNGPTLVDLLCEQRARSSFLKIDFKHFGDYKIFPNGLINSELGHCHAGFAFGSFIHFLLHTGYMRKHRMKMIQNNSVDCHEKNHDVLCVSDLVWKCKNLECRSNWQMHRDSDLIHHIYYIYLMFFPCFYEIRIIRFK